MVGALLLHIDARRTLLVYVPFLLPVAIAFFVTNYLAHGVWRPAYAHRDLGSKVVDVPVEATNTPVDLQQQIEPILAACAAKGIQLSPESVVRPARREGVYELWDERNQYRLGLRLDRKDTIGVYTWDDWYDYPNSYWIGDRKKGVDRGESNQLIYAFHCLIGHHGIFSLTPFWFLALAGAWTSCRMTSLRTLDARMGLQVAIIITTLVCVAFYLLRPLEDRNYGGVCSGLRWVFWLTPLWIWLACDAIKQVKHFAIKRLIEVALLISIYSSNYPWSNPWIAPWIMKWWEDAGWIKY